MRIWKRYTGKEKRLVDRQDLYNFLMSNTLIECDTETTGLDPHINDIICIQFGNPEVQYLVEWTHDQEFINDLKVFMRSKDVTYIFHNAAFDLKFLYKYDILTTSVFDTFLAESVLTMGKLFPPRSLKALAQKYLKIDLSKEIRKDIPKLGLIDSTIDYGLDDVQYLTHIKHKQDELLDKWDLQKALSLENTFVKVLAFMEYWGINFDPELWKENISQNEQEISRIIKQMDTYIVSNNLKKWYNYAGFFINEFTVELNGNHYETSINWGSPKQVAELFTFLGLDVSIDDGDGGEKDSIGKEFLQKNEDSHELVGLFSQYIKLKKLLSSFGEGYLEFINPVTNRIHTSYKQIVSTGRMSSGNKRDKKPNLQQLPASKEYRRCFIAGEGKSLIASDYSGMESVVFANKTLDKGLLHFYDSGQQDMHSFVASKCFPEELKGLSLEEIKKQHPNLRQDAKAAGFAIKDLLFLKTFSIFAK